MVDRHLAEQRFGSIHDHLERIARKLPPDRATFLADRDAHEAVAFNLFLAFQDALDLAARLIADRSWPLPTTAREHFEILARQGVLSAVVAEQMAGCAGLRNLIAHSYGTLDLGRLYDELPAGVSALRAYCAEIEHAL